MKNLLFLIIVIGTTISLTSCNKKQDQWEYKVVCLSGITLDETDDISSKYFFGSSDTLNVLGKQGWELVGVYTETETVYPDFGGKRLIIHYKENVRTSAVIYILKRRYVEQEEKSTEPKKKKSK